LPHHYEGKPTEVDGTVMERLMEFRANRDVLCKYTEMQQKAVSIHVESTNSFRLLAPFNTFLFFENWKQDLWVKRFVRDHVRYIDEIYCAAARVVAAVRKRAQNHAMKSINSTLEDIPNVHLLAYDSVHIRRGDFQYKETRKEAIDLYESSKDVLKKGTTLYIATDERNKKFFEPFFLNYDVCFLDDFLDVLEGVNTNYFGMLDQLVASRGRTFVGTYFSTFTAYINRLRGYYATRDNAPGHEVGMLQSYYFNPSWRKHVLRKYHPPEEPFWAREFPSNWRDIDRDVDFNS